MITQEPLTTTTTRWTKICDAGAVAIQFMDTDITLLRISSEDPNTASGVDRDTGHTFFSGDWFRETVPHPVWVRGKRDETTIVYSCEAPVDIVIPDTSDASDPPDPETPDNVLTFEGQALTFNDQPVRIEV